jgi:hypothetical protein
MGFFQKYWKNLSHLQISGPIFVIISLPLRAHAGESLPAGIDTISLYNIAHAIRIMDIGEGPCCTGR